MREKTKCSILNGTKLGCASSARLTIWRMLIAPAGLVRKGIRALRMIHGSARNAKRIIQAKVNVRNGIERSVEWRQSMSELLEFPKSNREKNREVFRLNFILAGGDPAKCDVWFDAIDRGEQPSDRYRKPQEFRQIGEK